MTELNAKTEQLMTRYLLGTATEDESVEVEARFLREPEYLHQLRALECELLDDYLHGELPEADRRQFERQLQKSPERRAQLQQARRVLTGLDRTVAEEGRAAPAVAAPRHSPAAPSGWRDRLRSWLAVPPPALPYATAALALLLLWGGLWLWRDSRDKGAQLARLEEERQSLRQTEQRLAERLTERQEQLTLEQQRGQDLTTQLEGERARSARLQKELDRLSASPAASLPEPSVVAFALAPGLERSADEPRKLVVPAGARFVRLQLELNVAGGYRGYRAELRTGGGSQVWSQSGLAAQNTEWGRFVILALPVRALPAGEYELTLQGLTAGGGREVAGYYYFIVAPGPPAAKK